MWEIRWIFQSRFVFNARFNVLFDDIGAVDMIFSHLPNAMVCRQSEWDSSVMADIHPYEVRWGGRFNVAQCKGYTFIALTFPLSNECVSWPQIIVGFNSALEIENVIIVYKTGMYRASHYWLSCRIKAINRF